MPRGRERKIARVVARRKRRRWVQRGRGETDQGRERIVGFVRKQSDWEREDGLIFLFFLGLISFPKPCVNIGAKNYMAYIKERREYLTGA